MGELAGEEGMGSACPVRFRQGRCDGWASSDRGSKNSEDQRTEVFRGAVRGDVSLRRMGRVQPR